MKKPTSLSSLVNERAFKGTGTNFIPLFVKPRNNQLGIGLE